MMKQDMSVYDRFKKPLEYIAKKYNETASQDKEELILNWRGSQIYISKDSINIEGKLELSKYNFEYFTLIAEDLRKELLYSPIKKCVLRHPPPTNINLILKDSNKYPDIFSSYLIIERCNSNNRNSYYTLSNDSVLRKYKLETDDESVSEYAYTLHRTMIEEQFNL